MEYIDHGLASPQSPEGKVPEGFSRIEVGEIVAYTNGKPRQGKDWHSDGSKLVQTEESEIHRAGTALTCGELQIISRVQGPQTSYRAELQGARLFADVAENGDTLTLDNKSVVDYGPVRPHREASDMDYRVPLADKLQSKKAKLRWIPSHREESKATSPEEKEDIRRNNEVDILAKISTQLPLEDKTPVHPHSIVIAGAEAPTPAKKWLNAYRRYGKWTGAHWTTWLPLRGTRRMLWLQWLWGNVRWEGCAAPWDKSRAVCSECNDTHGQTAHKRLIQCPKWKGPFLKAWTTTWERWQPFAETWLPTASEEDMHLVSLLRIPLSFLGTIPLKNES